MPIQIDANELINYTRRIFQAIETPFEQAELLASKDEDKAKGGSDNWDPNLGTDDGGNIDADPLFVDPNNDDYRLPSNSPCVNAGDPNSDPNEIGPKDVNGQPRIMDGIIDIGAHEYNPAWEMKISGGEYHTMLLKADGTVWACGDDSYGQLGNDNNGYSYTMIQVHDGNKVSESNYLEDIAFIDAGWKHSLAVDVNGFAWSWGGDTCGQLGNGNDGPTQVPMEVHDGNQTPGESNQLENIVQVAAGRSGEYSLALDDTSNRYVWAWGLNIEGQLGNGQRGYGEDEDAPVQVVDGNQTPGDSNYLENIVDIDAGILHSIGLDSNGHVWCWGYNSSGQLGNGKSGWIIFPDEPECEDTPVQVHDGEQTPGDSNYLENIVDVAVNCGLSIGPASFALDANGYVWAWGNNYKGQLGDDNRPTDSNTPVQVHDGEQTPGDSNHLEDIIAISAGDEHALALDKFGYVWAWGDNYSGQLGNGGTGDYKDAPVQAKKDANTPLADIIYIDAGFDHSLAIDVYGDIWVWGRNQYGQLGLGDTSTPKTYATKMP